MTELQEVKVGYTVPPTIIKVELGYTLNTGNFENLRISIGVEDHVREGETTATATERVYQFVENKVNQKLQEEKRVLGK